MFVWRVSASSWCLSRFCGKTNFLETFSLLTDKASPRIEGICNTSFREPVPTVLQRKIFCGKTFRFPPLILSYCKVCTCYVPKKSPLSRYSHAKSYSESDLGEKFLRRSTLGDGCGTPFRMYVKSTPHESSPLDIPLIPRLPYTLHPMCTRYAARA